MRYVAWVASRTPHTHLSTCPPPYRFHAHGEMAELIQGASFAAVLAAFNGRVDDLKKLAMLRDAGECATRLRVRATLVVAGSLTGGSTLPLGRPHRHTRELRAAGGDGVSGRAPAPTCPAKGAGAGVWPSAVALNQTLLACTSAGGGCCGWGIVSGVGLRPTRLAHSALKPSALSCALPVKPSHALHAHQRRGLRGCSCGHRFKMRLSPLRRRTHC